MESRDSRGNSRAEIEPYPNVNDDAEQGQQDSFLGVVAQRFTDGRADDMLTIRGTRGAFWL